MDQWPLTEKERREYMAWVLSNKVPQSKDYNMEQFYRASQNAPVTQTLQPDGSLMPEMLSAAVNPNDGRVHFPDAFKYPNHPTFSTHSNYYDPATMPNTPTWQGGALPDGRNQSWTLRRPNGEVVESEAPWLVRGDR